jgi:hypothetical protein
VRRELSTPTAGDLLACARYRPARILGDPERASATRGLHTVGTGVGRPYRHHLLSLPETVGFEICGVAGVRVLIHVIELLRRRRHTQLRHGGGVLRLVLLADVIWYRDGGEYPDNNDDRIVAKPQTQGSSGFVRCSQKTVSGE